MRIPASFLPLLLAAWPSWSSAQVESLPSLPEPVSNNAVALLEFDDGPALFSLQGLAAGKTFADIHARAWMLAPGADRWSALPELPVTQGRLAGAAIGVGEVVWLFGGYTVDADGAEVSTPEVFRIRGVSIEHATDMPVPVDDMTVFSYADRYLYLVSGWHDLGNVNLVQVLDTRTLEWSQATPYPGAAVFGHAGGLAGDTMLVCGGVRIHHPGDGSARQFLPSRECWLGEIAADDHRRIRWRPAPHHPGPARYRAAATSDGGGQVVFVGGSDNPYNYDGIGYDGEPSAPLAEVLVFDIERGEWKSSAIALEPSMDHRGLLFSDGWFYVVGGMRGGQRVSAGVFRFRLD